MRVHAYRIDTHKSLTYLKPHECRVNILSDTYKSIPSPFQYLLPEPNLKPSFQTPINHSYCPYEEAKSNHALLPRYSANPPPPRHGESNANAETRVDESWQCETEFLSWRACKTTHSPSLIPLLLSPSFSTPPCRYHTTLPTSSILPTPPPSHGYTTPRLYNTTNPIIQGAMGNCQIDDYNKCKNAIVGKRFTVCFFLLPLPSPHPSFPLFLGFWGSRVCTDNVCLFY